MNDVYILCHSVHTLSRKLRNECGVLTVGLAGDVVGVYKSLQVLFVYNKLCAHRWKETRELLGDRRRPR